MFNIVFDMFETDTTLPSFTCICVCFVSVFTSDGIGCFVDWFVIVVGIQRRHLELSKQQVIVNRLKRDAYRLLDAYSQHNGQYLQSLLERLSNRMDTALNRSKIVNQHM